MIALRPSSPEISAVSGHDGRIATANQASSQNATAPAHKTIDQNRRRGSAFLMIS
jgi:hypothetical protein